MKRPIATCPYHPADRTPAGLRRGYTLVEILVATALMAVILTALTAMLATVTDAIGDNRSALEMAERLRGASHRLAQDLEGLTVTTLPPRDPGSGEGMLVITEGPIGPIASPATLAFNLNFPPENDSSAGDPDDVLHFTTRSDGEPFLGKADLELWSVPVDPSRQTVQTDSNGVDYVAWNQRVIESDVAEVIWFVRGNTLYRRQLIVLPNFDRDRRAAVSPGVEALNPIGILGPLPAFQETPAGFYNVCDLSVHWDDTKGTLVGNSLGDLTKPENRFAYDWQPLAFPHHPHRTLGWSELRMPTLQECSHPAWLAGAPLPPITLTPNLGDAGIFDPWLNPHVFQEQDPFTGTLVVGPPAPPVSAPFQGPRIGEDVVLTNVLSFDVKVWDPGAPLVYHVLTAATLVPGDPGYIPALDAYLGGNADFVVGPTVGYGAYVDLNYLSHPGLTSPYVPLPGAPIPRFSGPGDPRSGLDSVYDTWSTHFAHDGINQGGVFPVPDAGTNGFDDNGDGVVDDPAEAEAPAPYPHPLRGIQIKIRVFEPDSRIVREVTIVQDLQTK